MRITRRWPTLATAALLALSLGPPSVQAQPNSVPATQGTSVALAAGGNPCTDRAYTLMGGRWTQTLNWRFKSSSTPRGLDEGAVTTVLKRSFRNIVDARNDCGRPDKVSAQAVYKGVTDRPAGISGKANCTGNDGTNVVSFGSLPAGVLGVTCTYFFSRFIIEADIKINSRYPWALSAASCSGRELLEPTVTHEVGHAFGMGHVSERRHGELTMSTRSDGPCNNDASTLGLGDLLGLQQLY